MNNNLNKLTAKLAKTKIGKPLGPKGGVAKPRPMPSRVSNRQIRARAAKNERMNVALPPAQKLTKTNPVKKSKPFTIPRNNVVRKLRLIEQGSPYVTITNQHQNQVRELLARLPAEMRKAERKKAQSKNRRNAMKDHNARQKFAKSNRDSRTVMRNFSKKMTL